MNYNFIKTIFLEITGVLFKFYFPREIRQAIKKKKFTQQVISGPEFVDDKL